MKKLYGSSKLNNTQLVQAKVDKELFKRFRELKEYQDRSYRSMFERFMRFELEHHIHSSMGTDNFGRLSSV